MDITTTSRHEINASDLENLCLRVYAWQPDPRGFSYGGSWSFQADQLAGNDTDHVFDGVEPITFAQLDDHDQESVQRFLANGFAPEFFCDYILNDLCARGELPAGDYLVRISY
jgi:hypothetical protein